MSNVRVFDLAGRLCFEKQLAPNERTINITSLKPGSYLLNIYTQDGMSYYQKFIKQ